MGRCNTPTYVVQLPLKTNEWDEAIINKRLALACRNYRAILSHGVKQFNALSERKKYRSLKKELKPINDQYHKLKNSNDTKDAKKLKELTTLRNLKYLELDEMHLEYGLSHMQFRKFSTAMHKRVQNNLGAQVCSQISQRAWLTVEKLISGKANRVNFTKFEDYNSVRGEQDAVIYIRNGVLNWKGMIIPVIYNTNDAYQSAALESRVKFCEIIRKEINGKNRYYVNVYLAGRPPVRLNKNGKLKHQRGIGNVGLDIGPSSVAICADTKVNLLSLAGHLDTLHQEIVRLNRAMDRSKRATNKNKFNENGTIKKGNRDKWVYSNNYIKLKAKRKELHRVLADQRKTSHNALANDILELGDTIKVEKMSFSGLATRSSKTTINKKTGRINSKKRYGKAIAHGAPAYLLSTINKKLGYIGKSLIKVNTQVVKASQYNPITDEYIKKELSERWNEFEYNGEVIKIQRDIMSAFLIQNVDNLITIDRTQCLDQFDDFKKLHDLEIIRLHASDIKLSSFGI